MRIYCFGISLIFVNYPQTDTAQLYNTQCHLDIGHCSGASLLRLLVYWYFRSTKTLRELWTVMAAGTISGCRAAQGPWEASASCRHSMEIMLSTKTFDSTLEYTWTSTVLFLTSCWTDAKLSGIRSPWQQWELWEKHTWSVSCRCLMHWLWQREAMYEPWSDPSRKPTEQRHGDWYAVDTRETLTIDSMPWCWRSWCLRNPGVTTWKVLNQVWDPGSWTSESGNALLKLRWQMQSSTMWWWIWSRFFLETVCSWVHMPTAQLFLHPCCSGVTPLDTLERIRPRHLENERRWWQDASRLSQERQGEGQRQTPNPERKSHDQHDQQELYRHRHVQELWQIWWAKDSWSQGGGVYDTSTSNSSNKQKGKSHKKGKGKSKHVDALEMN